jgi:hypothetical protein
MEPEGSLPHLQVPAPVSILYQINPVHTPTSHFLNIHLNIILPSMSGSTKWSLYLRFPTKSLYVRFFSLKRATCPAPLILLNLITRIIFGEDYRSLSSSSCMFANSPAGRENIKSENHFLV